MPCRIRPRPVLVGGDLLFQDSHQRDQHPPHQVEAFLEGGMYVGAEDAGATRQSEMCLKFIRRSDCNSDEAEKLSPARSGTYLCQVVRDGIRGAHGLITKSGDTSDPWYGQRFDDLETQLLSEVPHPEFLEVLHAPAYKHREP